MPREPRKVVGQQLLGEGDRGSKDLRLAETACTSGTGGLFSRTMSMKLPEEGRRP